MRTLTIETLELPLARPFVIARGAGRAGYANGGWRQRQRRVQSERPLSGVSRRHMSPVGDAARGG